MRYNYYYYCICICGVSIDVKSQLIFFFVYCQIQRAENVIVISSYILESISWYKLLFKALPI
jgi:hypothetical protein